LLQVVAKRSGLIAFIANRLPSSLPQNRWLVVFAAFVFLGSNLVFAFSLQWAPALAIAFGAALSALLVWRRASPEQAPFLDAPIDARLLAFCLALATAILLLGGETHLVYPNLDWMIRDAALGDLTRRDAPIYYSYHGVQYFLRAPLGMYLLPAAAGKIIGAHGAHVALLAQNALLCGTVFYIVGSMSGGWRLVLLVAVFSGLDILPAFYDMLLRSPGAPRPDVDLWKYSSHITQLFWAPNHALPGFFFAALCLLAARKEVDLAFPGVMFAALLIWSPLAILPGLVYMPLLAWPLSWRLLATQRLWLGVLAAIAFLPVASYLTIDANSLSHGVSALNPWLYLLFIVIEIPCAFFLLWLWDRVATPLRGLLIASIGILLILPFFNFGPLNDLEMRASIPPLFILAFVFADVALKLRQDEIWPKKAFFWMVALGGLTPELELKGVLIHPSYAISSCDLLTASLQMDPKGIPQHYLAKVDAAPGWLMRPAPNPASALGSEPCWPDHPMRANLQPIPRE
jgi:hypothetical protein